MDNHLAQSIQPRAIQNRPLRGISKRLSQFYSHNRWTYKTYFFHFSIFISKNKKQNEFKFLKIIAIYILHYHDFFQKN